MKRAEEYRKKAEEAEARAETTRDPSAKQAYLEIAQQWRQLAEHAEHMEHQGRLSWRCLAARAISSRDVLHRRDRPSALVSSDRDAKPVLIVEEELIDRAGLPVSQGRLARRVAWRHLDLHQGLLRGAARALATEQRRKTAVNRIPRRPVEGFRYAALAREVDFRVRD